MNATQALTELAVAAKAAAVALDTVEIKVQTVPKYLDAPFD
jgi:hypothetical protein